MFLVGLGSAVASAQPADAATPERARELFQAGVEALDAGRFAEAAPLLERSLALNPRPSVGFNLAFARIGMGQPVEALRVLDRLLAGELGPVDPALSARAEAQRAEASAMIARLDVVTDPVDAEVRIDGRPRASAVGVELDPGPHVVDVSADGFVGRQGTLSLLPGSRHVERVVLAPAPAPEPVEESAWLWGTLAAVGAAAVIAIVIGVVVYEDGQPDVDFTVPALWEAVW